MRGDARGDEPAGYTGVHLEQVTAVDGGVVAGTARREQDPSAPMRQRTDGIALGDERVEGAAYRIRLLGHFTGHLGGHSCSFWVLTTVVSAVILHWYVPDRTSPGALRREVGSS